MIVFRGPMQSGLSILIQPPSHSSAMCMEAVSTEAMCAEAVSAEAVSTEAVSIEAMSAEAVSAEAVSRGSVKSMGSNNRSMQRIIEVASGIGSMRH